MRKPFCSLVLVLTLPGAARAQSGDDVGGESLRLTSGSVDSVRSKVSEWQLMPPGAHEVGANLAFVTSAPSLMSDDELRFTDVALLRIHARSSIKGKAEVFGGADLLVKQPSFTDEAFLQSAHVGVRTGLTKKSTINLSLAGGTLLDRMGYLGAAAATVQRKWMSDETLMFEIAGGAAWTGLKLDDVDDPAWLAEVTAHAEAMIRCPNGCAGAWIGFDFFVPVEHESIDALALDPQTRINVTLGAAYTIVDDLDLFAELAFLDRGDRVDPATTLPILDGGFDQRQFVFGVIKRFPHDGERRPDIAY